MSTKLYVGNLSYGVTDSTLSNLFAQVGTVASAKIIMDRLTGRGKGFGFVEMSSDAEAKAAVEKLNGTDFEGRTIKVSEARPEGSKPEGGFRPRG